MKRKDMLVVAALAFVATSVTAATALATTSVKDYVVPVGDEYVVDALFSVDDKVPVLGDPAKQYRMVGLPDGLGAHANGNGTATLYMNHEIGFSSGANPQPLQSEPVVGGPKNRGAIVSKWILDGEGNPIAGRRAYDWIFNENDFIGPAPEVGNATRAFSRFCSGSLAGPAEGFLATSTSRTRRKELPRTASTRRVGLRSRSWPTPSTRCPSSAASRGRTPSCSRIRAIAR